MVEKITCPKCNEKVETDKIDMNTEKVIKKEVGEFLGICDVDYAFENNLGDAFYYCSNCGEKFTIKDVKEYKKGWL